jgi:hypothetical protein
MQKVLFFLLAGTWILVGSCRKNLEPNPEGAALAFSADTVFLDTIFTTIGSSTRLLKVFNPSSELITTDVRLGNGNASYFRMNVNGISGKEVTNVEILPKDSIYVFIEVTVDVMGAPDLLYTDSILFSTGPFLQHVQLVTLAKDAHFHLPDRVIQGIPLSILPCNAVWTNDKPHVVYGYAAVDSGCSLTLLPGTEVRFHNGSGLWIASGGSLLIDPSDLGTYENPVLLAGDRLEPAYRNVAGQWGGVLGGIFIQGGSVNNRIRGALIQNATIAIQVDSSTVPNLEILDTRIYNSSRVGLYGGFGNLSAKNLVIGSSGLYNFYGLGGAYRFTHCTFGNYWNQSSRNTPALALLNFFEADDGSIRVRPIQEAYFGNCIVYGQAQTEVAIAAANNTTIPFFFSHSLLRIDPNPPGQPYDVNDPNFFDSCVLNQNPRFVDAGANNYQLDSLSAAVNIGLGADAILVPNDILGNTRLSSPDAGAYERQP